MSHTPNNSQSQPILKAVTCEPTVLGYVDIRRSIPGSLEKGDKWSHPEVCPTGLVRSADVSRKPFKHSLLLMQAVSEAGCVARVLLPTTGFWLIFLFSVADLETAFRFIDG